MPLQALLVPHLRLADVQRLAQTCRAARALVHGLPEATLQQLAQACARLLQPAWSALAVLSAPRVQEARLPGPKVSMRQQLDLWARQTATVRAGGLHLGVELGGLPKSKHAELSPHADQVVACLSSPARAAVLVQVTGTQLTLATQLSTQRRGQTLNPPDTGPAQLLHLQWCSTGQRVVLVGHERTPGPPAVRVSTFEGTQLVGSHLEPLTAGESWRSLHASDDAATMLVTLRSAGGSRVVACTAEGAVTARHPSAHIAFSTAPLDGGDRLLAASTAGNRLHIYSASRAQQISLHYASLHPPIVPILRSSGSQALVLLLNNRGTMHEFICIDLAQHEVQQHAELFYPPSGLSPWKYITLGARSVALDLGNHHQISVIATLGADFGKELFRCQGDHFQYDPFLGRFLAVARNLGGVHILNGTTGEAITSWDSTAWAHELCWSPDGRAIVMRTHGQEGKDSCGWYVLRLGAG